MRGKEKANDKEIKILTDEELLINLYNEWNAAMNKFNNLSDQELVEVEILNIQRIEAEISVIKRRLSPTENPKTREQVFSVLNEVV